VHGLAVALGIAAILGVLWDSFETIILPRSVTRRLRLTKLLIRGLWRVWGVLLHLVHGKRRQRYLSFFGPLAMLCLLGVWAAGMVFGFALIHWGLGSQLTTGREPTNFGVDLYMSGTTFTTLGLGDVHPSDPVPRLVTVLEGALGFGFLAIVIGYMPVLYQAFSEREANISLLDARAGSPSAAGELLRRLGRAGALNHLDRILAAWERWSAELLESHISYPILCYFRSQHDNQSWLTALATILDTCAIAIAGSDGPGPWQAELTFAMGRHAAVDLAQILNTPPRAPNPDRLPEADAARLIEIVKSAGLPAGPGFLLKLAGLRGMYEPYVDALAEYLRFPVPTWVRRADTTDNWRTSAWEHNGHM